MRVIPQVVQLKRDERQWLVQGCDIYIGQTRKESPWNLRSTKWRFKYKTWAKYKNHIRNNSSLYDQLDELNNKVLGCCCDDLELCHGHILIHLFREKFPQAQENPQLWQTHYYPQGYNDQLKRKRKNNDDKEEKKQPPKKKSRKKFRSHLTNPLGIRHNKKYYPWPENDVKLNQCTIWIDEAGRGSFAGPLHVGACILLPDFIGQGFHDSKLLKVHEREKLYDKLMKQENQTLLYHIASVSNDQIDSMNIQGAWEFGIRECIDALKDKAEQRNMQITDVVLDGNRVVENTSVPVTAVEQADSKFVGVAAASVLAKVSRDRYMRSIASEYPEFKDIFAKGYGYSWKPCHAELIRAGKYTNLHRISYNPLKAMLNNPHRYISRRKLQTQERGKN